jgi:hypothetical protein
MKGPFTEAEVENMRRQEGKPASASTTKPSPANPQPANLHPAHSALLKKLVNHSPAPFKTLQFNLECVPAITIRDHFVRAARLAVSEPRSGRTFWPTGITARLQNGGRLEISQQMAAQESARTTGLYDRRNDEVSPDEVEPIGV